MSAPLRIRYVTGLPAGTAALFHHGSGLLELRHDIGVDDLAVALGDVARILTDRPTVYGTFRRHLAVVR